MIQSELKLAKVNVHTCPLVIWMGKPVLDGEKCQVKNKE